MRGHNLGHGNTYWRVTEPFEVYVLRGTTESNTSVGSSKMLGNVYQPVTVEPGGEIHGLVGGVFYIDPNGSVTEVTLALSDKHPFEKVYLLPVDKWPLDKLALTTCRPVTYSNARTRRFSHQELKETGAASYGRNIDWILPHEEN